MRGRVSPTAFHGSSLTLSLFRTKTFMEELNTCRASFVGLYKKFKPFWPWLLGKRETFRCYPHVAGASTVSSRNEAALPQAKPWVSQVAVRKSETV